MSSKGKSDRTKKEKLKDHVFTLLVDMSTELYDNGTNYSDLLMVVGDPKAIENNSGTCKRWDRLNPRLGFEEKKAEERERKLSIYDETTKERLMKMITLPDIDGPKEVDGCLAIYSSGNTAEYSDYEIGDIDLSLGTRNIDGLLKKLEVLRENNTEEGIGRTAMACISLLNGTSSYILRPPKSGGELIEYRGGYRVREYSPKERRIITYILSPLIRGNKIQIAEHSGMKRMKRKKTTYRKINLKLKTIKEYDTEGEKIKEQRLNKNYTKYIRPRILSLRSATLNNHDYRG